MPTREADAKPFKDNDLPHIKQIPAGVLAAPPGRRTSRRSSAPAAGVRFEDRSATVRNTTGGRLVYRPDMATRLRMSARVPRPSALRRNIPTGGRGPSDTPCPPVARPVNPAPWAGPARGPSPAPLRTGFDPGGLGGFRAFGGVGGFGVGGGLGGVGWRRGPGRQEAAVLHRGGGAARPGRPGRLKISASRMWAFRVGRDGHGLSRSFAIGYMFAGEKAPAATLTRPSTPAGSELIGGFRPTRGGTADWRTRGRNRAVDEAVGRRSR